MESYIPMSFEKSLKAGFDELGLTIPEEAEAAYLRYLELLTDWNTRMNLTAVTDPDEAAVRHFADSAAMLRFADIPQNARLIDVGTGAGFPSLPCAVLRPDLKITLLDSLRKRLDFLTCVTGELKINASCVHARAEDGGHDKALREKFDVACARAVAALPVLCEYCLPFVRVGGVFAALKGPGAAEELEASKRAVSLLGGKVEKIESFELGGSKRCVVTVRKISHTPTAYPRTPAKISKNAL